MSKPKLAVLSAAVTTCVLLMVVVATWVVLKQLDGLGRDELWKDCATDPTLSGLQGYCVVVSRYPAGPVHSERTYLEVAAVHDGAANDYRFVAGYPFAADDAGTALEVDWSEVETRVVVTDPATGGTVSYPADVYVGGR